MGHGLSPSGKFKKSLKPLIRIQNNLAEWSLGDLKKELQRI